MKKFLISLGIIAVFSIPAFAVNSIPGSQNVYTGYGATEVSRAYTGISELGSMDGNTFNPASMADARRLANSLTIGGFGGQGLLLSPAFALPTDIAVFSINALYFGSSASNALGTLLGAQIQAAKPITENLFIGLGMKLYQGSASTNSDFQFGFDLGFIVRDKSDKKGLGFFDLSYGAVLKNIGKTITLGSYDPFPAMGLGLGASFNPIKLDFYQLKILGDLTVPFNPFNIAVNVGIENTLFDFLKVRGGYVFSSQTLGITSVGPFNLGVGIVGKFKFDPTNLKPDTIQIKGSKDKLENSTDIELSYALQNQSYNQTPELAHFVNLSVAWGYYDDQKPSVQINPDTVYFSPNFDGSLDEVRLGLGVKDNTMVNGWELTVYDKANNPVKTFKSMEKTELRTLTPLKFLQQLIARKQQVEIPANIAWTGQDETGKVMPDGTYTAVLKAWDDNKNTAVSETLSLSIDTVVPKVEAAAETLIYSPNGDGMKDALTIGLKSSSIQPGDQLNVLVMGPQSNIVRTFHFENSVPDKIIWDGKDDQSNAIAEAVYSITVSVTDTAGNFGVVRTPDIALVTTYEKASLTASLDAFSPNGDGIKDVILFSPVLSSTRGLQKWVLTVQDKASSVVQEFTGGQSLPGEIIWDGRDKAGRVLQDGLYSYTFEAFFDSGNHPKTTVNTVKIRNTPPKVTVTPEYLSFSPNADGKQDTLTFTQKAAGEDGDQLEARILDESGNAIYYNSYTLKDAPSAFVWNGLDKDLKPLPEGKYTYSIDGADTLGNKSSILIRNIILKTGLEKVAVQSDTVAISPKNPEAVTKAVFTPQVTSKTDITSFSLVILDEKYNAVKTFKSEAFTDKFTWDGKDDSGRDVKDGNYTYALKVKYAYGDEPVSAAKPIKVDTAAPVIKATADDTFFSPNKDGRKETITIKQSYQGDKSDVYSAAFVNSAGTAVKTYKWTGDVPETVDWDGLDDKGGFAPEGVYSYQISGIDTAKNQTSVKINTIKLVRTFEKLDFSCNVKAFTTNADSAQNKAVFTAIISSTNDLTGSELLIIDSAGKTIARQAKTILEKTMIWDGRVDGGAYAKDGYYTAQLLCDYASGNLITAVVTNLLFQKTPPTYRWTVTPELFTPDNDGEGDSLYMNLDVQSPALVKNWEVSIYKKLDKGAQGPLFKKFSGTGNASQQIQWDGISDDKQDLVEAVQDYSAVLTAEDSVGNKLSVSKNIAVGVLVERTPEGLRIRVSSIQFAFDSPNFVGNYGEALDKVILILRKILSDKVKYGLSSNSKIEISGHTDDVGADDYNQNLSEKRAKAVYQYFMDHDIDPKILAYVGYGETLPYKSIQPGMSKEKRDEYRARNRRVEFFIRK